MFPMERGSKTIPDENQSPRGCLGLGKRRQKRK
jgi:hypothetical protein